MPAKELGAALQKERADSRRIEVCRWATEQFLDGVSRDDAQGNVTKHDLSLGIDDIHGVSERVRDHLILFL
jgi:hypothetical protein